MYLTDSFATMLVRNEIDGQHKLERHTTRADGGDAGAWDYAGPSDGMAGVESIVELEIAFAVKSRDSLAGTEGPCISLPVMVVSSPALSIGSM